MSSQRIEEVSKRYMHLLMALVACGFMVSSAWAKQVIEEDDNLDTDQPVKVASKSNEPAYVVDARKELDKKNYKKVIELLWPKMESLNSKSRALLAQAYAEEKSWIEVLKVCQLGLAQDPQNSDLLAFQGKAHYETGKEKIAIEDLKAALESNPKNEFAYETSAKIYEKRKNNYELRMVYQDMIDKIGPKAKYFAALCKIDALDVVNEAATKNCSEALKLNPKDADSAVYLATVYNQIGQAKDAEALLRKTAKNNPKSEIAQQYVGQFYEGRKDYLSALPYFLSCVKLNEKSEPCLSGAAQSAVQTQKFDEAAISIKKLCDINRKYGVQARKAMQTAENFKNPTWAKKFSKLADDCAL